MIINYFHEAVNVRHCLSFSFPIFSFAFFIDGKMSVMFNFNKVNYTN